MSQARGAGQVPLAARGGPSGGGGKRAIAAGRRRFAAGAILQPIENLCLPQVRGWRRLGACYDRQPVVPKVTGMKCSWYG